MAIQALEPLSSKKKKKTELIKPRTTVQGDKLFGTTGVRTPVIPSLPRINQQTVAPVTPAPLTTAPLTTEDRSARGKAELDERNRRRALTAVPTATVPTTTVPTTPVPTVQPTVDQGPSRADIEKSLLDASTQRQLNALKTALARTRGGLQAEEAALIPEFRQKEAGVRTRDTMARAGEEKFLSGRGLGDAGATAQSDIAQTVATQGAIGALNQQELAAKADIKRRLSDAEALFAAGELDVRSQAEQQALQSQLDQIVAKEQAALKQAEIQDERDYDLFIRELDNFDDREKAIFENDIQREQTILDAQIQEARDNRQFGLESRLIGQKNANAVKLEGIKQAGRLELKGQEEIPEGGMSVSSIGTSINNFIKRKESDNVKEVNDQIEDINKQIAALPLEEWETRQSLEAQSTALKNQSGRLSGDQQKQAAMLFIIENPTAFKTADDLREVLTRYGIDEEEIVEREAQIKTVPASQGF